MSDAAPDLYRELYEDAPCGYLTVAADGTISAANRTLLQWIGRRDSDVIGSAFLSLLPPADRIFYETRFAPVLLLSHEVREAALSFVRPDGTLPILLNARLMTTDDGAPIETRMAVFDSTERQSYERQLLTTQRAAEASESRVRTLQEASNGFGASSSEAQLAELLADSARDAMSASSCAVVFVDDDGETSATAGEHPLAEFTLDPAHRDGVARLRTAGTVALSNLDEVRAAYPWLVEGLIAARVEAFSIVPIPGVAAVTGALMCFFQRPRTLSAEDLELQLALVRQASHAVTRIRLQNELVQLALYDQLTGLANRRLLREHIIQGMAAAARRERPVAMLVLDLDGFKSVNDVWGHQAGDAVLTWVAHAISDAVRGDDVVGRFGGDEFVVLCHDADRAAAEHVAARIRAAIAEYPGGLPDGRPLAASVGIAVCDPEKASTLPDDFFAVADAALLTSKREGKDRVTVATV